MAFVIMGITGQVGGALARALLREGKTVRGVVRRRSKALHWENEGVELVEADIADGVALREAFGGAEGLFVMLPPNFAPSADFREARAWAKSVTIAVRDTKPNRIVVLSSIGAQHDHGLGLITQPHLLESSLLALPVPTAFLRPAWFMENARWDVAQARESGTISSFLHPLDKTFPMVAAEDVGRGAAELLAGKWTGQSVVEMEGPRRYSPNDLAAAFSAALGTEVVASMVPHDHWEGVFRSQGTSDPSARIEMLDGFNSGWIEFHGVPCIHSKGRTELATVVKELVEGRR
jgi:uncharacterized protein YbjT (DUF2867 family)